ncbi:MAG: PEP-CTERM sorting domain-containing protein [Myxococcota bacterium]
MDKMRLFTSVLASVAMLFAASTASALVTFTTTQSDYSVAPGEQITIDIRVANPGGGNVFGVGAAAFGWDNGVVNYVSGNSVAGNVLASQCFGAPVNVCIGGMNNSASGARAEGAVTPVSGRNVQILNAVDVSAHTGEASDQAPGLDGVIGGGDAQFRLVFQAVAPGVTTIEIGTNPTDAILGNAVIGDGGSVSSAANAFVSITVVPEPGTALLMGLGLAGLAVAGRRE